MAGLARTFQKGCDPCTQATNAHSEADPKDSGSRSLGPDAAGSRVARGAAPGWSRRAELPPRSRKPRAQPVGIRGGRGKGSARGQQGEAEATPPVGGASLLEPRAPGFGSRRALGSSNDLAGWDPGRASGKPARSRSPAAVASGVFSSRASRSPAELRTTAAPAHRKERECGKLKGAAVPGRLCAAPFPPPGAVLRVAARSQKPVWWVNTALERPWIQQSFSSLMPWWRTTPCLSDLGLPALALVRAVS